MDNKEYKLLKFRFGLNHRLSLYKKLKSYIEEEFPVFDSLVKFKTRFDKKKDYRGKILAIWIDKMKSGSTFSNAIKGWVPDSELNLISAGEDGTGIENGLHEAIRFATSAKKIKATIIQGSAYPLVLFFIIIMFIGMFSIQIAPTYLKILPLERWPDTGKYLYYLSYFITHYWYILFGVIAIISAIIISTISKWTGPTREFADRFPPWSVYKVYQNSAFLISLASMMKSGVPLNDSLKKIKSTSSHWLASYIELMLQNLKRGGKNFGMHLDVGLLDEETAGDVIDYSELGRFEQAVYSIGEDNLENSVERIDAKMAIVKNIMLLLVGLSLGWVYFTNLEVNGIVADNASSATTVQQQSSGIN